MMIFRLPDPCTVALEACGGAHYWAREIGRLGHVVRLIPPAYVKPFVKQQKNDVAEGRLETLVKQHGIKRSKNTESIGRLFAAYLRRADGWRGEW